MGAADSSPAAADGAAASSHEPVANGPPRGLESGASADDDKATESTRLPSELEASSHRPELLKLRSSRTVAPVPWRYLALLTGLLIATLGAEHWDGRGGAAGCPSRRVVAASSPRRRRVFAAWSPGRRREFWSTRQRPQSRRRGPVGAVPSPRPHRRGPVAAAPS